MYWQTDWKHNTELELVGNYREGSGGRFCSCIRVELGGIGFNGIWIVLGKVCGKTVMDVIVRLWSLDLTKQEN